MTTTKGLDKVSEPSPPGPMTTLASPALARPRLEGGLWSRLRRAWAAFCAPVALPPSPASALPLADAQSALEAVTYAVAMGKTVSEDERPAPLETMVWKLEGAERALRRVVDALETAR